MTVTQPRARVPLWRRLAALFPLLVLWSCGAIQPMLSPHPKFYSFDTARSAAAPDSARAAPSATTLIVLPPHAAAGFDSQRIVYLRQASQMEYFAHNEWIDTPARMLAPMIVAALARSGAFRAVVTAPSLAAGEMRLATEILHLQQEFLDAPSQVRFALRASIVDSATRRVIATREFEAVVPSASENPYGGVAAAASAVQTVLEQLAAFCAEAARGAPPQYRSTTEAFPYTPQQFYGDSRK